MFNSNVSPLGFLLVFTVQVRLIALDFDLTLLDTHTGGSWEGTAAELVSHVRPQLYCLVNRAQSCGLHVAVVTFSDQTDLIHEVMEICCQQQGSWLQ